VRPLPRLALTVLLGGGLLLAALEGGSYQLSTRATIGTLVWWALALTVAVRLLPLARPPAAAIAAATALAGLAVLALASSSWGASAERAFEEANRASLYLGVFLAAVLAGTRGNAAAVADGLALGIAATGLAALASRFVPEVFPDPGLSEQLADAGMRLSWPLGYWNGLALFIAIGVPLLLRAGIDAGSPVPRGLAVGALPAIACAIFLASSRGGLVVSVAAALLFLAAGSRRFATAGALATAGIGSALAVAALSRFPDVVDRPEASGVSDRVTAGLLVLAVCVATGAANALSTLIPPRPVRVPRAVTIGGLAILVAAAALAVIAADPRERFDSFTRSPAESAGFGDQGFTQAHLFSSAGSGRWQFWGAAVDAFEDSRLQGQGAGSYEAWWARNGSFAYAVKDAHSLYLEALGELGIPGLLLLAAFVGVPLLAGIRRVAGTEGEERGLVAALLAAGVAFALAAAIDWVWELTAVGIAGVVCLGLLAGPATTMEGTEARPPLARLGFVALAAVALAAQAVVLLGAFALGRSRDAAGAGDLDAALRSAGHARALQPWAATPHLQLALLREQAGQLGRAAREIDLAIERDPSDWRLAVVAARIETKRGRVEEARRELARALELNPRSPLLRRLAS
jgi:tetratricopeptide (TPR) repeat protein/multisubunit Na+/H+ antiporter MnhG subunit